MARKNLNRGLGALAALGALSYHLSQGRGRTDGGAPVEDRSVRSRPQETFMGLDDTGAAEPRLQETFMGLDDVSGYYADTGGVGRSNVTAADQAGMPPPAGPAVRPPAAGPAVRPAAASTSVGLASPDADFPLAGRTRAAPTVPEGSASYYDPRMANLSSAAVGRGEADAIRNAANAQRPLREQLTDTTLGVSTGPAPGAPSIYAGSEAWRLYNQQKAAEAAAAGPSAPQGSARNIRQQMREKDKEVLAAVRRRQAEEEAAAKTAREAAAERRREARRVEPPAVGLNNPYYGITGAQRAAALRAKGGAIKTKKMASGGMTSASKRADGIASKGKTKCKMY
jgi:hypothetical protein